MTASEKGRRYRWRGQQELKREVWRVEKYFKTPRDDFDLCSEYTLKRAGAILNVFVCLFVCLFSRRMIR